jgi:hypothetical protein
MYKIRAWIKENGIAVRYVREGFADMDEVVAHITTELSGIDVLDMIITKEI